MTDTLLFTASLGAVIVGWLVLLAGYLRQHDDRRSPLIDVGGLWFPAALAVLHAVLLGLSLVSTAEQGSLFSLPGIIIKFADHQRLFLLYLEAMIFSLFIGRWIALDAMDRRAPKWLAVLALLLQCGLGPPALALWLGLRAGMKAEPQTAAAR